MHFVPGIHSRFINSRITAFLLIVKLLVPNFVMAQKSQTQKSQPLTQAVDSISVIKSKRLMMVFGRQKLLKQYSISLGQNPIGPKHFKGDRKTPEGLYQINGKSAQSMAHKCLGISYPNEKDRAYAQRFGKSTGGDVKIHGFLNGYENEPESFIGFDWTWGCIAVTNDEVDELFEHVVIGSNILIQP